MSTNRKSQFVDINNIGVPDSTYPNPSCHIVPVVFDETGEAWVQLNSISFRDGKLKATSGGALESKESILEAGLREAAEESRALPLTASMVKSYSWMLAHPKYTTFSLAAFVTNQYFTAENRQQILDAHNAEDKLAKDLLDIAFLPEDKTTKEVNPNDLISYGKKLAELIAEDKNVLPKAYLILCQEKLVQFQNAVESGNNDAIKASKKDLLETIRIKTEFVGRQFVKLNDLKKACKEVLSIDQMEKAIEKQYADQLKAAIDDATRNTIKATIKNEQDKLPKKPEFVVTSHIDGQNNKKRKMFGGNVETINELIFSEAFEKDIELMSKQIRQLQSSKVNSSNSFTSIIGSNNNTATVDQTSAPMEGITFQKGM